MTLHPDRLSFTFAIHPHEKLEESYDPSQGATLLNPRDFARQGTLGSHSAQVNRLFVYTDKETDRVIQRNSSDTIAMLRTEMDANRRSIEGKLNQASEEILKKIAKIFDEKSSSGDSRSISQRFEALDHDIRQVKAEVVKQVNSVLVEEVKKESQSEIATLRAELDASKAQVKTLQEQLQSLATEVTKLKEQSVFR